MAEKVGIAMGSGVNQDRIEAAGMVCEALRPAVMKLSEIVTPVSLLDGLMSLYLNTAIACGADPAGIQSALIEAATLFPEALRRHLAMIGHDYGNA